MEVFSGKGGLSRALSHAGLLVRKPRDAYPKKGVYIRDDDVTNPIALSRLVKEIDAGVYHYIHFGVSCATWGAAGRLNRGTRRVGLPAGDVTGQILDREVKANHEADCVIVVCDACQRAGVYYSIENPADSHLFQYSSVRNHVEKYELTNVVFDQCQFQLKPPDSTLDDQLFVRKRTRLVTNTSALGNLSRKCPGVSPSHRHVCAWGNASVQGRSVSRAKAAGVYPYQLCHAWADIVKKDIYHDA